MQWTKMPPHGNCATLAAYHHIFNEFCDGWVRKKKSVFMHLAAFRAASG
jgi:hypothetical protein